MCQAFGVFARVEIAQDPPRGPMGEASRVRSDWIPWGIGALARVAAILSFGLQSRLVWDDLAPVGEIDTRAGAGSLALTLHEATWFDERLIGRAQVTLADIERAAHHSA